MMSDLQSSRMKLILKFLSLFIVNDFFHIDTHGRGSDVSKGRAKQEKRHLLSNFDKSGSSPKTNRGSVCFC